MPIDILLDDNFDILIENGDLVLGECTRQNQVLLLYAEKGEIREFPTRGIGIRSWILDEQSGDLNSAIKREFEADGMTVLQVKTQGDTITTEAVYNE